ncbi:MAG: hypothetical protein J5789_05680 [Oscillospiraceae bacterium]|nr:hypothetical protein [Oscillospiraceae bacterium]
MDPSICETCWHYDYDEEQDEYYCRMELDEDEFARVFSRHGGRCPYYQKGDDYYLPRH